MVKEFELTNKEIEKLRRLFGILYKNIYWEHERSLMPYDSVTYIFPYISEIAELLKIKHDGIIKKKDKRGYWR